MALTPAQQATMKTDIEANSDLNSQPNTFDGAFEIARLYNLQAVPDFIVWRTSIPTHDVKLAIVWTEYIGRSVGERSAFELMISNGEIDASDINIRQGIQDVFSGPGGVDSRTNLTQLAKRAALRVEKLFSTGTGSDASPATMDREGTVNYQEVYDARNS